MKVSTPQNLDAERYNPYDPQNGKNFVVYDTGSVRNNQAMLQEIEQALVNNGIQPSVPIQGDRQIPGSNYLYYRNDKNPYKPGKSVRPEEVLHLDPEQRYNPFPEHNPDIYANVSVNSAPSLTARPSAPASPVHIGLTEAQVQGYLKGHEQNGRLVTMPYSEGYAGDLAITGHETELAGIRDQLKPYGINTEIQYSNQTAQPVLVIDRAHAQIRYDDQTGTPYLLTGEQSVWLENTASLAQKDLQLSLWKKASQGGLHQVRTSKGTDLVLTGNDLPHLQEQLHAQGIPDGLFLTPDRTRDGVNQHYSPGEAPQSLKAKFEQAAIHPKMPDVPHVKLDAGTATKTGMGVAGLAVGINSLNTSLQNGDNTGAALAAANRSVICRKETAITSSSPVSTVERGSFGPMGASCANFRCFHLWTVLGFRS